MYNSISTYQAQLIEAETEDNESLQRFLQRERARAEASYHENDERRFCGICNELLVYRSISYDEGYHIDSCL